MLLLKATTRPAHDAPADFQPELLPLHSPLLGESLLVSFPPLSYMLKSSGSSYLISGPIVLDEGVGHRCVRSRGHVIGSAGGAARWVGAVG